MCAALGFFSGCGSAENAEFQEYEPEVQAESEVPTNQLAAGKSEANPNPERALNKRDAESSGDQPVSEATESGTSLKQTEAMPGAEETEPVAANDPPSNNAASPAGTETGAEARGEKMTSGQTNAEIAANAASAEEASTEPRTPKLLIPEKEFRAEGPENALRVTFDDIDLLKVLNMEPVPENAPQQFPDWLRQLEGQRVRIRGFMFPTLSQTGITYFQHVRDNEICCFGRTPKVYDRISTVLKAGETTNYIQGRPFDVIGTFRIDPVYEDGEWLQLYLLEDAVVIN